MANSEHHVLSPRRQLTECWKHRRNLALEVSVAINNVMGAVTVLAFLAHATVGEPLIGMFTFDIGINCLSPGYSEEV